MWLYILWAIKIAVCLFTIYGILILIRQMPSLQRFRATQKLPGPEGFWILGNLLELTNRPMEDHLQWLQDQMKVYKRLMRVWFCFVSNVYLAEPDDIQALFNNTLHIDKGLIYNSFRPWLGEGLLTSTGDKWHFRRKLLTPAFHFKILEENLISFNKCSKDLCKKLLNTNGKEVDVESLTTLCTLDIIMGTAMGIELNSQMEISNEYVTQLKQFTGYLTERILCPHLFFDWMFNLSLTARKFYKSLSYIHDYSNNVIKERKSFGISQGTKSMIKKHQAFLDTLIKFQSLNPALLNDKDIREEVDTFMFEGHDTTSVAIMFIIHNLSIYPEIQDRVYNEMFRIFGSSDREVTCEDLNKMTYLEKVVKESLRLYPSVPGVSRLLKKDLILDDGVVIPAKVNAIVPIYLVHRNEKYWENPGKFDPERFSEDKMIKRHPYAYIPFSAGPRNCIGQRFAMMELKTVISSVIRQFKIEPSSNRKNLKTVLHLVLRPYKTLKCKFIQRRKI